MVFQLRLIIIIVLGIFGLNTVSATMPSDIKVNSLVAADSQSVPAEETDPTEAPEAANEKAQDSDASDDAELVAFSAIANPNSRKHVFFENSNSPSQHTFELLRPPKV